MSSYFSQVDSKITRAVVLKNPEGGDINISCSTGDIKINGIVPTNGGGGVGILPPDIDGTGNITTQGNITATGDGILNGKIVGQTITSTDNIVITAGSLEVTTGGVDIKGNGNLSLEGNGDINVLGTGNIGVGVGGITSSGDIETSSGDIVSAGDFIFEGDDIQHRTNNPVQITSYVQYKQLPQLNVGNTFTGANKFNDNVTEFAEKVSVGTRDAQGLFTQTIALNKSGNIESQTIQNVTSIQTGTLNCGNGGTNSCAARTFTTRTSGLSGWNIEQVVPSVPPSSFDNILNFRAGQVGGYVTITDSVVAPGVPNIILDPKTKAIGGLIKTTTFEVGQSGIAYKLTQPITGANTDNLLIKSGSAVGEAIFQDELDASIMTVKKTEVQLGNTISLSFGAYSFRPQQFYKDITNFSFNNSALGATNLLFNTGGTPLPTDWTNRNTGATGQNLDLINNSGAWKITIRQLTNGTLSEIDGLYVMSDIVLSRPNDNAPNVELAQPTAYSYQLYDGVAPIITMIPAFLSWAVHAQFPSTTGNETANIRITMTQMPYF